MTDISKEAVERHLDMDQNHESGLIPISTRSMLIAMSDHIAAQDAKIANLEAAIKRQASAARTLRQMTLEEVQHLKDKDRSEYTAAKTVDSEREANAILTEELEERDAKIAKLVEALRWYETEVRLFATDTTERADVADELLDQDGGKVARQALASIGETDD